MVGQGSLVTPKSTIGSFRFYRTGLPRLFIRGSGFDREKKQNMSTEELLEKSWDLSVHQLEALLDVGEGSKYRKMMF